jgi:hypothetical protein
VVSIGVLGMERLDGVETSQLREERGT